MTLGQFGSLIREWSSKYERNGMEFDSLISCVWFNYGMESKNNFANFFSQFFYKFLFCKFFWKFFLKKILESKF